MTKPKRVLSWKHAVRQAKGLRSPHNRPAPGQGTSCVSGSIRTKGVSCSFSLQSKVQQKNMDRRIALSGKQARLSVHWWGLGVNPSWYSRCDTLSSGKQQWLRGGLSFATSSSTRVWSMCHLSCPKPGKPLPEVNLEAGSIRISVRLSGGPIQQTHCTSDMIRHSRPAECKDTHEAQISIPDAISSLRRGWCGWFRESQSITSTWVRRSASIRLHAATMKLPCCFGITMQGS